MKIKYLLLILIPLSSSIIINLDPNKDLLTSTDSDSTFSFYVSLDQLPNNSSGVINVFPETEFSLTPLIKKFSDNEKKAQSFKENEDEIDKIKIESFSDGKRFRILFKKTSKKEHFLSVQFRKEKSTKIYFSPSKLFSHKETNVHDIIEKAHKIKSKNPIYFYINLKTLMEYREYEITQTGNSQITFFTENQDLAPLNIYHIDENINTFNLNELIQMQEDNMIMEIYNEVEATETFIAKHTAFEYYESLNWEMKDLLISTHQIIPKNKDDIHKFILNKDSLTGKKVKDILLILFI